MSITVSTAGPIYATGSTDNTSNQNQVWTAQFSSGLVFQSSHVITSNPGASTTGRGIVAANGKVYVVGMITDGGGYPHAFIARYTPELVFESSYTLAGNLGFDDFASKIIVDPQGTLFVVGRMVETVGVGNCWIAKFDPNLVLLASSTFDSGGSDDSLWDIVRKSDGDLLTAGVIEPGGVKKIWIGRYDSALVLKASATISGPSGCSSNAQGRAIALDSNESVYVSGQLCDASGRMAAYLAKLSPSLTVQTSVTALGDTGDSGANSVAVDAYDHVFTGGMLRIGAGTGSQWLAEFTTGLVFRSSITMNGGSGEYSSITSVVPVPTPSSGVYASGYFFQGAVDAWLGRLQAAPPLIPAGFSNTTTNSISASWTSGYPAGTLYYAQVSSNAAFAAPVTSSNTFELSATFSGLTANSTYYAQVATAPGGPFTSLGSTVTWMQPPTAVYFDEISSYSIVAAAYSPTPAFSNLNVGLSGTNVARDGVYAGWHGEAWTSKASMPTARYFMTAAAINGRVYALGGYTTSPSAANEEYDPSANAWASKTSMPTARNSLSCAASGGLAYVMGGETLAGFTAVNEAYNPASNSWSTKAPMQPGRQAEALTAFDGSVYSLGGASNVYTALNGRYVPDTNTWSSGASLPAARAAGMAAAAGGRVFAIGGLALGGGYTSTTYSYDPASDAWTSRSPMPTPRHFASASVIGGKIYVIGGSDGAPLIVNEEYDPAADTWTARSPMPTARAGQGAGVVNGRAYLVGGTNGVRLSTAEEFDPGVAQRFAGLQPNTLYTFKAKARNLAGVETGETSDVSTYTLAAIPLAATPTFSAVAFTSVTVSWTANGNPGGTEYRVRASTASDFNAAASSQATGWLTSLSTTVSGLASQTTWYFGVQARNAVGVESSYASLGSTVPLQFVRQELPSTVGYALRIALGDFDGDGDLDAALAQATTLDETILRNDGGGAFTKVTITGSGGASNALAACDFDSDGDLDLLVGNDSAQDEVILRNDGGLSFTKFTLTGTAGNTKGVACGDYDNDGDQDAVVANDTGQSLVLLRNNGGLNFTQTTLAGSAGNNRDVKWIDYDSDGDLDIFVAQSNSALVMRNDGDAGFTAVAPGGTVNNGLRVALADFDLDGDLDPVLVNNGGGYMVVYRSDGAGALSTIPLMSSTAAYDASWADYDGDGDPDVLFGEVGGDDFVARNDGNGVFTRLNLTGSKGNSNSAAWGDFDGDGDLDVLLGKALTANAVLMKNVANSVNAAPSAPGGMASSFQDSPSSASLTVTWSAAAYDGAQSTAGLSYALVVATAPMVLSGDSMRVVSPSSFVVTWNYAIPPGGNAQKALYRVWPGDAVAKNGLRFRLDLNGVLGANFRSDATYYFRLQTLDAGLARSTWSSESSAFLLRSAPSASISAGASSVVAAYSTSGAAGYLLRASTAPDFSGTLFSASAGSAAASVTLGSLVPGTTYYLNFGALWQNTTVWATPNPASTAPFLSAPAGCVTTVNVGAGYVATLSAALAAVPASLSAETCVVIRDTGTYREQVTVAGKATNGFRLRILGDPTLAGQPTIDPPAGSTAAFQVKATSVTLENLRVAPSLLAGWGIWVSSPYATVTNVLFQSTVPLSVAAVELETFGRVEYSTVSAADTRAVYFNGSGEHHNTLFRSTFSNASAANHTLWFSGPDNTVSESAASNTLGTAVMLGDTNSVMDRSTATTGAAGLYAAAMAFGASSCTIRRSFIRSSVGRGLVVSGSYMTVAESTITTTGTSEYGLLMSQVTHSTVARTYVYSATGQAVSMQASANWNRIEKSTMVAGSLWGLDVQSSSYNTVLNSHMQGGIGGALRFTTLSNANLVQGSTMTSPSSGVGAYLNAASTNTFTSCHFYSATGSALNIQGASNGNLVQQSTMVADAPAGYALYLAASGQNTVLSDLVSNTTGYAAFLAANANGNLIDLTTVTARASGYSALYLDNASTNTVSRSYFHSLSGTGVTFGFASSSNTLTRSTVAASGATAKTLHVYSALDSLVNQSWLIGAGYGAYVELSQRAVVTLSTVTGSGAVPAFMVAGSSGVFLRDSYVSGPDALDVFTGTGTVGERTTFNAVGGSGKAVQLRGGSVGLTLASATLRAGAVGLVVDPTAAGPLAVDSMTVTASTAVQFQGGTQVATITAVFFPGSVAVDVDASALPASSRVTMRGAAGPRAGTLYETDPQGVVDWLPDSGTFLIAGFPAFPGVFMTSVAVQWSAGGYPGATFYAQLSTSASFAAPLISSNTLNQAATFTGLTSQTTYYARVATAPAGPFTALGSTVPLQFLRQELPGTVGYALRIAVADFDGDGDLDAALAQATGLDEAVLRNDGGGAFTKVTITGSGGASNALAACDFDSDGDLDLLVGNDSNQDEFILRNDGGLSFTKVTLTGTAGNTKGVACGDYDGDGDADGVVANDVGQSVVLLRNNGSLSFTQTTVPGTTGNNRDLKFIDYDADGDLDVFLVASNGASVLRNDGDAGFVKVALGGAVNDGLRVAAADTDLDGDLDVGVVNNTGGQMLLYRSDAPGAYTPLALMSSTAAYDVAWGDYDGDGDPDALYAEVVSDDILGRNDGGGTFTRLNLTGSKANSNSAAWGDFDGDGDLDVLLGKALTANMVLMRNVANTVNAAPGAPGGLTLSVTDSPSSATLTATWSAAPYDGAQSTAGLSYSLVMATAPMALSGDSMRVVSPSSFVATWNYAIPPGGNAQKALYRVWPGDAAAKNGAVFRLDLGGVSGANLRSDATYYFRLQTLDAGLARSSWSAETSAFVLRAPPAASVVVTSSSSVAAAFSTSGAAGYLLRASTASNFSGSLFTASVGSASSSVALTGLSPDTTYFLNFGALWQRTTVWAAPVPASTVTFAAVPAAVATAYLAVYPSSAVLQWSGNGNPASTQYRVGASTAADFNAGAASQATTFATSTSAAVTSLTPQTTWYFRVQARNSALIETAFLSLGSTPTPALPLLTAGPFSNVSSTSLTASWGSTFPGGTLYYAQVSTDLSFVTPLFSSATFGLTAAFTGLSPAATYYAQVATAAAGPFTALGSTRTRFGDIAGCATSRFVLKAGGGDCTSLGACVAQVPSTPLTGDFCIAVLDSAVYSEQVVVQNKAPNGFRIRLWGAAGARPTVTPPAGSAAAFRIANASVSLSDVNVVATNTVTYGVLASSAYVALSSIAVDSGGKITGAGVFLSSWTTLSYSSVTVQAADGVRVTGYGNTISFSTAAAASFGGGALYLNGASSTTVRDSAAYGMYGAFLYHSHRNTFLRATLSKVSAAAGGAGVYLNDATSNTFSASFISNAGGTGADLATNAHYNLIELSTVTAAGSVYSGLEVGFGRGNRLSRVYVHGENGNGAALSSGSSESVVEHSTFSTAYAGAAALSTNGSSETVTDNRLYAPYGTALGLYGSSVTVSLTYGVSGSPSYPALAVWGGGYVAVRDSSFENSGGDGGKLTRTSGVDILRSTVSGAGGGAGLRLEGASSVTVAASRLAAPGGTGLSVGSYFEPFDLSTTTGTGNVFTGLDIAASTAAAVSASVDVALTSSVLSGDSQGTGLFLGAENGGVLAFSNLTIAGPATGLGFGNGVVVATVSAVSIDSAALLSADGSALQPGSRITVRDASGARGGSLYEEDPLAAVDWVPDALPFVPPAAPAGPTGLALGASSIAWSWAAVPGAESYRVRASSDLTLLDSPVSTGSVLTSLSPNTTYSIRVAAFAKYVSGALSVPGTAVTRAAPPAGLSALFVTQSSAALQWTLNGNPAGTFAELQRSTDASSYALRAGTLAATAYDTGLVGCTSYYYRVRNRGHGGFYTDFDGPVLVRTLASTPSAPGDLSAQSVPGRRVSLTWNPSATEGIVAYRLYKDTGTGVVDYSTPYAQFSGTTFSTTTVALSSGVLHLFGLRAVHRCGIEETNTHAVASAWALESLDGVRASIKVPATGKKISGNRVLVMAELDTGNSNDVSSILFQYRSTGSASWTDIPAANVNHPNPDREQPFFVHWDVTGLADRAYDLRAVASDVAGASDPAPGTITVLVDSVNFEVKETDLGGGKVKKEQAVSNETSNTVATAESGSAVVTKVVLPAGALNTSDATLSATANPAALPAPPPAATSLGASIEVTLSNGQSQLANGQTAAIVFNYPDDDDDGVIDGTQVRAENAEIQTFDVASNAWKKEFATAVDKTKKTLTGQTPHFSLFAAFGVQAANLDAIRVYPNPYKPNGGNADEGRPFSRADPLSGVIFDNLPAVVTIKIYTLTGRLVSELGTSAGTGAVQWDGKNDQGEDVATGGYFAVITSPGAATVVKKIGVIR